ncbi:MAG: 3-octaprenyl-4-hydroxybenzoate carboxy-lyase, partial [Desulfovibrio sp.]|nr:3-octaprenyl-4-hydroxybenzoate carboxy-lyase [Desulfovibrio sp.]
MNARIVFAISGASGMPLARDALNFLSGTGLEIFLIVSREARRVMLAEGRASPNEFEKLAAATFAPEDFAAPMASGSWLNAG